MEHHVGYPKNSSAGDNTGNSRNGHTEKTVLTEHQRREIAVPRDRNGTFEPVIVPKYEKRIPLFNNQIISLYASGMTTRDIKAHLEKIYGIEVSPELISRIPDAVMEEVCDWQTRQLDSSYPIVYLDALRVNTGRTAWKTCNKAQYTALGVNFQGKKGVLGFWIADTESAKFWMNVLNELKNRGIKNIVIACTDGLTGFPGAIRAVYPNTRIQLCIVHMVRNSTKFGAPLKTHVA